ncbi:MAG: hypothetical protein IJX53_08590 [Clostridia bacterium]|nr:hypothetical protein [Clostridia bacterium]
MNEYYDRSMPIGLAMMLAQNNDAMRNFALMSETDQQRVLDRARSVSSKTQMRELVGNIATGMASDMMGGAVGNAPGWQF